MRRFLGLLVLVPACEQVKKIDDGGGACVPAEVQAAFDRSCGTAACHTDGGMQGMLSLAAGQSGAVIGKTAVGSPLPLVELGNTSGSYLAQKITSDPVVAITGDRMPVGFSAANENHVADVNTILTWIGGGVFECADGSTGDTMDPTVADSGSTGEMPLRACGLQDLAPGTASMIVSGTDPMQIPPDIVPLLEDNCGCHYTNEYPTPPPYLDYQEGTLPLDMRTIAGFRANNAAMPPVPYHDVAVTRMNGGAPIAMPPPDPYCEAMPTDQFDTLVQWLTEGAPDCTTWAGCGETIQACGIEDIKPGAPNPIVSGTGAMELPTDIGAILGANCGCHYVDDPTAEVTDYLGTAVLATWAGFQAPFGMAGDPLHVLALSHVESEFMPLQASCNIGGGVAMPAADRAVLVEWLTQGAPDGATWVP